MELIKAGSSPQERSGDKASAVSAGAIKKYTYVLPSGRRLKVVVDDDAEHVQTASSPPCFVLRMEDDPEP